MNKFSWWRRFPRKWQRMGLILACLLSLHFVSSLWKANFEVSFFGFGFGKVKDPFESRQTHQCSIDYKFKHSSGSSVSKFTRAIDRDVCYTEEDVFVDIFGPDFDLLVLFVSSQSNWYVKVSDVYDSVSVNYPSWVLTVIGWSDTIKVPSWSPKPLVVIVLPHSHQDPGWLRTMESYYNSHTRHTLDYMIDQLTSNPSYKFIWSEVIMLEKWWTLATLEQRQKFRKLLGNGQLEIVSGGWVMTDESVAHYGAMVDQLTEGHIWLKNTLNVTIQNSWAVDPFGHSSTMAYLLKQSGIQNMVIQRTHYALKRQFASKKHLEFFWRQAWDSKGTTDVFCHMMPFLLYSIPHSCGPDRHVCCKFDFHSKHCFYGNKHVDVLEVNDKNLETLDICNRSTELWQQLQKKSELYQADIVLMPHGDDFRYDSWDEWTQQFGNLQKIMNYINNKPEWQMQIKFGTLKDYFNALSQSYKVRTNAFYPAVSGDFFLYSDRDDQYWSGFYTTRPFFKYLVRQLQQFLRSAEIMFSFTVAHLNWNTNMTALHKKLTECRRTLALCQHHDAITGTSKKDVMEHFTTRVQSALRDTVEILKTSIQMILSRKNKRNVDVNLTEEFFVSKTIPLKTTLNGHQSKRLLVWNDLGQPRNDVVEVVVDAPSVMVSDSDLKPVPFQISPVWTDERKIDEKKYLLTFKIAIEPFSLATFVVQPSLSMSVKQVSKLYRVTGSQGELNKDTLSGNNLFPVNYLISPHVTVSNAYMTAVFKQCNGMLHSVHRNVEIQNIHSDIHFVTYSTGRNVHPFKDKSGAYIFLPDGVAQELKEQPEVYVTVGNVFSEVRAVFRHIVHVAKLYNVSGMLSKAVHIENYVNINSQDWNNYELVMRLETDVVGRNQHFCTDSNGYQMHPRKTRAKMHIQGNVYPMTSAAIVENEENRVSLLSAQSHGVASLVTGWIEVFLDRRLVQDDWRGLNEGVKDNVLSKSSFFILFEDKIHIEGRRYKQKHVCLPTMHSEFLMKSLNSPLKVFEEVIPTISHVPYRQNYNFARGFPCSIHVLNIRMLDMKEALITLHRSGIDCHFSIDCQECKSKSMPVWSDLSLNVKSVIETSLTGVKNIRTIPLQEHILIEPMTIKTYKLIFA